MNCLPSHIQGGYSSRSRDHYPLFGVLSKMAKKNGFSCTSATSDKKVLLRLFHHFKQGLLFSTEYDIHVSFLSVRLLFNYYNILIKLSQSFAAKGSLRALS